MNVSIVIPVSSDLRLKECIESIDEKVEVVISLNKPSKQIKALVEKLKNSKKFKTKLKFVICEIPEASIARGYNNGIHHSTFDKILLMDSDCIFEKGTIRKLNSNLSNSLLSKGRVVFKRNSWLTSVVARAREFHTSDKVSAYSPPLLFSKKIKKYIGGYFFHDSLCWLEDSEFDKRVQVAKLTISYDSTAVVYHPPLTLLRDLKSSFWYGVGKRIGVELGIHDKPTGLVGSIKKYVFEASKAKGLFSGIYLFIWKVTLLLGYNIQGIFKLRQY